MFKYITKYKVLIYTLYYIVVRGFKTYLSNIYYLDKKRYTLLLKKYRSLQL